jgi:AbiJ N-terminal domain 3
MSGDLGRLRELLQPIVMRLASYTHKELAGEVIRVGLPEPPGESFGSKADRVRESLASVSDADLPAVAEQILMSHLSVDPTTRNAIQDIIWAGQSTVEIPKRTRREIARSLDLADLVYDSTRFMDLLDSLWVLDNGDLFSVVFSPSAMSLRALIEQHVFRNPEDWTTEYLFEQLGVFDAPNARVARFLAGLVSPDVVPDEPTQRRIVDALDPHLRPIRLELRETGTDGGYPVFSLVSIGAANNQPPKNIIFASPDKPDLRFRDAINNDIEIVTNADKVLVYDRSIGADGLRWRDLQAWWMDTQHLTDEDEAKRSLYQRLIQSLPTSSPPQRNLFALYHSIYGSAIPGLPALLPEVWLYWDHKTVLQRGALALLRFRMDFLLLLPYGQRVVIEVDGAHHYSSSGKPDGKKYADNMRGDRDLKLSGYEVFRFGAVELLDRNQARCLLEQFFADLFKRFDVTPRRN